MDEWESLCRALNVAEEETLTNLTNYYTYGGDRLYYCFHQFFDMGEVTWEKMT